MPLIISRILISHSDSLLSREESTAIKGLLIILIVLGHNKFFTTLTEPIQAMGYLYNFHIQSFFILPFLYGSKKLTWRRIGNSAIKLLWPYILVSTLLYLGYYVYFSGHSFHLAELFRLWGVGNGPLLMKFCGIQILWFLPAMFALTIIKDYYYQSGHTMRLILLLLSSVAMIPELFGIVYNRHLPLVQSLFEWTQWIPFSMFRAMSYLLFGVLIRRIILSLSPGSIPSSLLWTTWTLLSVIYFGNVVVYNNNLFVNMALRLAFPVLFFIIINHYKAALGNLRILLRFGNNSYPIYLFHPFLGYILIVVLEGFGDYVTWLQWLIAAASMVTIIWLSLIAAEFLGRYQRIHNFIFPTRLSDIYKYKR